MSEMLTAKQVMARLKLGRTTVYGLGRRYLETDGAEGLPCRKIGRALRFPADQIDEWMTAEPSSSSGTSGHRGVYVGATRGRNANHLHVLTDAPDAGEARDVLEFVIARDRADIPAIARRRQLADELRPIEPADNDRVADAERAVAEASERAAPHQHAIRAADKQLTAAEATLAQLQDQLTAARPWARRPIKSAIADATDAVEQARDHRAEVVATGAPFFDQLDSAQERLEREASVQRTCQRLDALERKPVQRDALGR